MNPFCNILSIKFFIFFLLADKNRDSTSSDSHVVPLQTHSKQCIFYPVKEEEREHLVEPPHAEHACLDSGELAGGGQNSRFYKMYLNNLIWNYLQYQIHLFCMLSLISRNT